MKCLANQTARPVWCIYVCVCACVCVEMWVCCVLVQVFFVIATIIFKCLCRFCCMFSFPPCHPTLSMSRLSFTSHVCLAIILSVIYGAHLTGALFDCISIVAASYSKITNKVLMDNESESRFEVEDKTEIEISTLKVRRIFRRKNEYIWKISIWRKWSKKMF